MKKLRLGILMVFAFLILVSAATANNGEQVTAKGTHTASGPSYWAVQVTAPDVISPILLEKKSYLSWCYDQQGTLPDPFNRNFVAYSSLYPYSTYPTGSVAEQIDGDWYKINWILNNPNNCGVSNTYDYKITQASIWKVAGQPTTHGEIDGYDTTCFNTYYASIPTHFAVQIGDKYAVILYSKDNSQEIIVEEEKDGNTAPEFPSIALPVGMLIGIVGLVYVVKKREN
jgi:hypothetical protein